MKCEWTTLEMVDQFVAQDGQKLEFEEYRYFFENSDEGIACLDDDGTPFALFAAIDMDGHGRKLVYTVLGENLGTRRLLYAARCARRWLNEWGSYRRVEAYCLEHALDEIHWCRYALGLKLEGILRQYTRDGQALYCFAWVNDGN